MLAISLYDVELHGSTPTRKLHGGQLFQHMQANIETTTIQRGEYSARGHTMLLLLYVPLYIAT